MAELKQAGELIPNQAVLINTIPRLEAQSSSEIENVLLLAIWEKSVHEETTIDPVIRMAVQHYQFEAIHPFTDGNGRTGRVLNLLMLIDQGLLKLPVLYLSRSILANKADDYRLLLAVTAQARWEDWKLRDAGVLEEIKLGRERIYFNRKLIGLLKSDQHAFEPFPDAGRELLNRFLPADTK